MKKRTIITITAVLLAATVAAVWFCTAPRIRELTEEERDDITFRCGPLFYEQVEAYYGGAIDLPLAEVSALRLLRIARAEDNQVVIAVAEYLGREEDTRWHNRSYLQDRFRITQVLLPRETVTPIERGTELTVLELIPFGGKEPVPTPEEGGRYLLSLKENVSKSTGRTVVLCDPTIFGINKVDRWGRITWQTVSVREGAALEGVTTLRAVKAALRQLGKG